MSKEIFDRFRMRALEDPSLQETLRAETDYKSFVELVIRLGNQNGYSFSAEDIQTAYQQSKNAWLERYLNR